MTVQTFIYFNYGWIALAIVVFLILLKVSAPYGRHLRNNWGPAIHATTGWIIMELVSPLVFAFFFLQGQQTGYINWVFFSLWILHYFNRSIIYPLRASGKYKQIPLVICVFAILFNSVNGYLNGYYLGVFKTYDSAWLKDMRFIAGLSLFFIGFAMNNYSDEILLRLRKKSAGYSIPHGGLYRWISCPNYLGEILEWCGWAIATWSLPGLAFAAWTFANLFPRALSHHKWYKTRFKDYPANRKAIIPFLI
ncbi:MAG: 3-oxo-5-alpha-steroid 4-dehydrogenase [Chitinophagales bacterium]|nr:MAG: 3-oxo-5-alpha-steroid 4-dehydrogenase [Chitinophagales bacterium]